MSNDSGVDYGIDNGCSNVNQDGLKISVFNIYRIYICKFKICLRILKILLITKWVRFGVVHISILFEHVGNILYGGIIRTSESFLDHGLPRITMIGS